MFGPLKLFSSTFFGSFKYALTVSSLLLLIPVSVAANSADPVAIGGILTGDNLWPDYRKRFITDDGRIIDTGNGFISHSEGQGYGMLLAVAAADRESFDKIWSWTRRNLYIRRHGFAAWKWSPVTGGVADHNNATDGDILIAWALAEAASFWNVRKYAHAALAQTKRIRNRLIYRHRRYGYVLKPGLRGFSARERRDGPVVNLSYWVFLAFKRFAIIDPGFDWNSVTRTGVALIRKAGSGVADLPSEWTSLQSGFLKPAKGFSSTFGYNAVRIPLYLVWSNQAGRDQLTKFVTAWQRAKVSPNRQNQLLVKFQENVKAEPGYVAIFDLAACITSHDPLERYFYRTNSNYHYYSSTLHALSVLAAAIVKPSCIAEHRRETLINPDWEREIFDVSYHEYSPHLMSAVQSRSRHSVSALSVLEKVQRASALNEDSRKFQTAVAFSKINPQKDIYSVARSSFVGTAAFVLLLWRIRVIMRRRRVNLDT